AGRSAHCGGSASHHRHVEPFYRHCVERAAGSAVGSARPPMSAHTPSVSVIIVTFNAAHYIERCLASVFAQSHGHFEVIVVDNASTDGSADLVRQRFPRARLIASPTNEGYGGGNNRGAGEASGEILVFLNPDAVPEREWLTQLTASMREQFRQYAT